MPTMSPSSCLASSDLVAARAVSASRPGCQYSAIPEIACSQPDAHHSLVPPNRPSPRAA